MTLLAGLLALVIGLFLSGAATNSTLSNLHQEIVEYRPIGITIRLVIIGALAACWSLLVEVAEKYHAIDETAAMVLHDARWRLLGWSISAELLIGADVLSFISTRASS